MAHDRISTSFPHVCRLLEGTALDGDLERLARLPFAPESWEDIEDAGEGTEFRLSELVRTLFGAAFPHGDQAGRELDNNLGIVIGAVGLPTARTTYRDKLLVNAADKLEDVRYEIAATARACGVLDPGSIRLEFSLPGSDKNSDVYGTVDGDPVRIEVTVLHERLPARVDVELDEFVRGAAISSGFSLKLRRVLAAMPEADRVRALVELLHEHHAKSGGADTEIDGIRFEWRRGSYDCQQPMSPIDTIEYDLPTEIRDIIHPVSTRRVTPKYIEEDHPQPKGAVALSHARDENYNDNDLGAKLHRTLADKLGQCEDGIANVVVFGILKRMFDSALWDAVYGGPFAAFSVGTDDEGVRHPGGGGWVRDPKAPFVPAAKLPDLEHQRTFIDPFRKLSAVWLLRLDYDTRSVCLDNPNAHRSVPPRLRELIAGPPCVRSHATVEAARAGDSSTAPEEESEVGDEHEEIVFAEMADDFVTICGGIEQATAILASLTAVGEPLADIRAKLERTWPTTAEREQGPKFVSPSNEEAGLQFVLDCDGYAHARAFLEVWRQERESGSGCG